METYTPVFIASGIVLLVMLVVLGVQFFITLSEFRQTLQKANKVLDDAGTIGNSVVRIPELLSAFLSQASKGVMDKLLPPPGKKKS